MYLRSQRTMEAWSTVRHEIIRGNVGTIILFYLMKFVLSIAIAIIALLATCMTCCVVAVPYLGTVILLPLFVFERSYSLCLIEQFGPRWQVFPRPDADEEDALDQADEDPRETDERYY